MRIFIQGVPERMESINKIQASFTKTKVELFCDYEKVGNFPTFLKIFNTQCSDYRLYLQDDVILPPMFEDYLPELEKLMFNSGIDILSLFAPRHNVLHTQYAEGKTIGEYRNLDWKQAFMVSPRANELIINFSVNYDQDVEGGDTMFLREFLKVHEIQPYFHLPSLVQHDVNIPSSMGHGDSIMRTSAIFDERYIELKLKGEPERERFHPDNFGRVKKKIWPWKNYVELYFMEKHYDLMIKTVE
jgi:hypothetical protein